ncbi:uncharacterized protein Dwil_GK19755 [Drosophila willistoni]|uniref:Uncharacterized protein n=3 Tax=Drosophila willistoni TaxID=7260 RepID=B4MT79_DROWI|nr:uncharacterized protein Dwil_GK19755 [Drosophila willistoni]
MAKIIPNAVGVATMDERHVFGSFISRESAFRLMCTVCPQLAAGAEILPKPLPVDSEMPEEFFNEDDSSCSISGNESPPQLAALDKGTDKLQPIVDPPLLRQRIVGNAELKPPRHSDMPGKNSLHNCLDVNGPGSVSIRSSAPPIVHYEEQKQQLHSSRLSSASTSTSNSANVSASSTGPPSSSSSPITVVGVGGPPSLSPGSGGAAASSSRFLGGRFGGLIQAARSRLPLPSLTELHVLYLGIMLSIMLALFSAFLLYRILDIEAKTSLYHTPIDFNWHNAGNDEDIFAEALRWQKELQAKSTAEAQHILSKNLEQITKVRRSLETLSMLIHDRRSGYGEEQAAGQSQQDLDLDQVVTASGQSHSVNSD